MALELAKPKAEEGPADLEPFRPSHGPATAELEISIRLCGTRGWGQHCTEDYNFPEVCLSIPSCRQGPSSEVQEQPRWPLYPGLGWWPVGGVKRVASHCEGGSCQRACLWPATADQLVHDTHGSHGREAGMLTIKPDKENQNKMRTLESFFFLTQKCMIREENDICQGDFW